MKYKEVNLPSQQNVFMCVLSLHLVYVAFVHSVQLPEVNFEVRQKLTGKVLLKFVKHNTR
jgi:hypothetical protein